MYRFWCIPGFAMCRILNRMDITQAFTLLYTLFEGGSDTWVKFEAWHESSLENALYVCRIGDKYSDRSCKMSLWCNHLFWSRYSQHRFLTACHLCVFLHSCGSVNGTLEISIDVGNSTDVNATLTAAQTEIQQAAEDQAACINTGVGCSGKYLYNDCVWVH